MREARVMVWNLWRRLIPPVGGVGWETRGVVGGGLSRVCEGKLGSMGGLGRDWDWFVLGVEVGGCEAGGGMVSGGK